MSPSENLISALRRPYATRGRAGLGEFWWWSLLGALLLGGALGLELGARGALDGLGIMRGALVGAWALIYAPTWLCVAARRLHDVGRSAWWLLLGLIPVAGWLALLWWFGSYSQQTLNRHGKPPPGVFWT